MHTCRNCGRFGEVLGEVAVKVQEDVQTNRIHVPVQQAVEEEITEQVVQDFSSRLRRAREKLGMDQKDFAQYVAEKESIVSKLENGSFVPSLKTARKLERKLNIRLIEEIKEEKSVSGSGDRKLKGLTDYFTLGHFIKVKKRK
jgi:putative transcription factor